MCEFISWKETDGEVLFLTDKDVFSSHGREMLRNNRDNDVLGHGAIDAFFGESARGARQYESLDFWKKDEYPPEIAQHLKTPQTLLGTWGRVLKKSLQPDDAYYILENAPKRWRDALSDLLFGAIVKDADYSYEALCGFKGLSGKQKDALVGAVANGEDVDRSRETIRDVKGLSWKQKDILVGAVAKDAECSYDTLCEVRGLSKKQKDILIQAVAKDMYYSYGTLRDVKSLSDRQKNILVSAVAKDAEHSADTLDICTGLSKKQKAVLKKAAGR